MITELNVNGFKSLNDFKIQFEKGLNVIVGPNGSGKTNICQAMTILSSLPIGDLKNCLNHLGGTNSIFNKKNGDNRAISISAIGICESLYKNIKYELNYSYSVVIEIKKESLSLSENLVIRRKIGKKYKQILKANSEEGKINCQILDIENIGDYAKLIENHKTIHFELELNENLWSILPKLFYSCYCVGGDIVKLRFINIDPNIVREPCDIIDSNKMLGNGKYLANELAVLLENKESKYEIESLLEQTLPNFESIKVVTSPSEFKRYVEITYNNGCSFNSVNLSDGTLKLLGVLVAIINQVNYTIIIEELENYLHPKVDRLLIDFLRESFINQSCILTSHSETVLNLIRPEELILCTNPEGKTECRRVSDIKQIQKAIIESGLGCGYHYVLGNF